MVANGPVQGTKFGGDFDRDRGPILAGCLGVELPL
jgi:hypothetical protein